MASRVDLHLDMGFDLAMIAILVAPCCARYFTISSPIPLVPPVTSQCPDASKLFEYKSIFCKENNSGL